jgi:hypothetical protein
MPSHEQTHYPSVAGRQQDQCPQARVRWEKVMPYLIWSRWCITRLIRWLTGASPPEPPIPETRSTWDTGLCSMEIPISEVPIARVPLRTTRYYETRSRVQESHSQSLASPTPRSSDFSSLGYIENGYFIPPIRHSDENAPIPSSSHMLSTPEMTVHPSPEEAATLPAETVRWPLLSSSSESDEELDDESDMKMQAAQSIVKLRRRFQSSSSESYEDSDEELYGRIRATASMAMVCRNPRRALRITTGGFCEALQSHTSLASPSPIEGFSSDPGTSLNASSLAFGVASTAEATEDGYEEEENEENEEDEEKPAAVRSILVSPVGRPTLIHLPARPQVSSGN